MDKELEFDLDSAVASASALVEFHDALLSAAGWRARSDRWYRPFSWVAKLFSDAYVRHASEIIASIKQYEKMRNMEPF